MSCEEKRARSCEDCQLRGTTSSGVCGERDEAAGPSQRVSYGEREVAFQVRELGLEDAGTVSSTVNDRLVAIGRLAEGGGTTGAAVAEARGYVADVGETVEMLMLCTERSSACTYPDLSRSLSFSRARSKLLHS
jgi:hypothetical protein